MGARTQRKRKQPPTTLMVVYLVVAILIGAAGASGLMLADVLGGKADSGVRFNKQLAFETGSTVPVIKLLQDGQLLNITLKEGPAESVRVDLDLVNKTSSEQPTRLVITSSPAVTQLAVVALTPGDASNLTKKGAAAWEMNVAVQSTTTFSQADLRLVFKAPARQGQPLAFQAKLSDVQNAAAVAAKPTSTPKPTSSAIPKAKQTTKSSSSGGNGAESNSSEFPGYNWEKIKGATPIDASAITLINTAFVPQVWRVRSGTKVTFTNRDTIVHQVAIAGQDATKTLNSGDSLTVTLSKPGTYRVVCTIHPPVMFGSVTVTQ